jgi:formamidopyrimidine-DNA glycosylase
MPELPEVETVVRGLKPHLEGRVLAGATLRRDAIRTPIPRDFAARVAGQRIEAVERRAKYVWIRLAGGDVVIVHLGMSGRLVLLPAHIPNAGPHDHVDFTIKDGPTIRFTDPRRFGVIDLLRADQLADDKRFKDLGPEPLDAAFDAQVLAAALAGSKAPLKAALLDQRNVAGLGNIYVCEALFRSGLSPKRKAGTVKCDKLDALCVAIKDTLAEAIAAGGSSARDYVQASGELGWFQHRWRVYDREDADCTVCAKKVKRIVQSGRSTFYCPNCQR